MINNNWDCNYLCGGKDIKHPSILTLKMNFPKLRGGFMCVYYIICYKFAINFACLKYFMCKHNNEKCIV